MNKLADIDEDPYRPELRNLRLRRNDALLNNFDEHMLLANLGNIDWRALLNLWSVLDYLTKYATKPGQGSKNLHSLFENVLKNVCDYNEDGLSDLWRRTIMKFYSRIIGDREYPLTEVVHAGLGLPPTISSFGDVVPVNVSDWVAVRKNVQYLDDDADVTTTTKMERFSARGELERPKTIKEADLVNLSLYAFWRLYDVQRKRLVKRQKEAIVAITGTGWSTHAAVTHAHHEDYAKRVLYAYMPCAGLSGIECIHDAVAQHHGNSFAAGLKHFVREENIHCPPWIQRNYEVQNQNKHSEEMCPARNPEKEVVATSKTEEVQDIPHDEACQNDETPLEPDIEDTDPTSRHESLLAKFDFQDAEPPRQDDDEDQRPEAYLTTYHWRDENRTAEQKHSSKGASYHNGTGAVHVEYGSDIVNPVDVDWSQHRHEVTHGNCAKFWQDLRRAAAQQSDSTFSIDSLQDDYQQLFVRLVLRHVQKLIDATDSSPPIPPLRLFLLGTAGTGKTRAVHTLLQNLHTELAKSGLPCDFVRSAAPTGSAAFNMRFGATTIHRLIRWFAPTTFCRLLPGSAALERLQTNLANARLILFDEISMVGRQFMGKIDDRLKQAKAGRTPSDASLGGLSCVCVGDPAQCEAMGDQQLYDVKPHKRTQDGETNAAARFSNIGLSVYSEFQE